jgi:hypothetical protein
VIGRVWQSGRGFKGSFRYMLTGEDGLTRVEDRVAWMGFHNLPTRDPEVAACMMAATANASVSNTRKPLYHFSVSCAPDDPVDRNVFRRIAARTIRDLGLQDYEVAVFAHKDRPHPHLHFVVNRVHPERHTLWSPWRDQYRIERSLRAQERELGLRIVPGWLAPAEPAQERAPARVEGPQRERAEPQARPRPGPERGDAAFVARLRARVLPLLEQARSWAELERGLAEQGLSLRVKGGGFRVGDDSRDVKASDVARSFSRHHLEQRFGPYPDYLARTAVGSIPAALAPSMAAGPPAPAVEPTPAPLAREARAPRQTPAPAPPTPTRAARPARAPAPVHIPPAKTAHRRIAASYHAVLARLYMAPRRAHARFRDALVRDGREAAVRALRDNPQAFGPVRGGPAPVAERARDAAQEAYRWAGRVEDAHRLDLLRAAAAVREHEAIRAHVAARQTVDEARGALAARRSLRATLRERVQQLVRAAPDVYQRPRVALRQVARSVRRIGVERTADALHARPEQFGALRTVARRRYLGLVTERDTTAARDAARDLADRLRALDGPREQAVKAGEVLGARAALDAAQTRIAALPPRVGHASTVEMHQALERAGRALAALERGGPQARKRLAPMLPPNTSAVVSRAAGIARAMAVAIDPEREHARERGRDIGFSL